MSPASGGRHALIVATARYDDPKLDALRAPATDAAALAAVLADPAKGAFEVETVLDQSQGTVARRIASFFRDRRPDDLLLVHFSCHGVKDDRGELFLAATDTEVDLLSATGVSTQWLNDQITRTRSRRTVVLLDCCFSGAFPFGMRPRSPTIIDAPDELQGRGRAIITASSAMEYAFEGDQLTGAGQPSIFTAAIVEGLETGRADLDGDGRVSVDDLYDYVYDRVRERTPSQTPSKKSDLEGPLYLATTEGGTLPQEAPPPVAPPPGPARRLRGRRRLAALAAAGVLAVGAVAAVVLATGDGSGGAGDSVDPTAWTPDWCAPRDAQDPIAQIDAQQAVSCDVPNRLVQSDVHGASATFARYGNAADARQALKIERRTLAAKGGSSACDDGAEQELTSIYEAGLAYCVPQPDGRTWVGFNDDGSDVTGSISFDEPTTEGAAVDGAGSAMGWIG
ncbi:caspase family protein [Baekduia sp. Peel2402]|uniref:caspase family protein n=1 Tax=Baekduia sp. Peel2402 TaxID=3458296 RepID=UPI00403E3D3B